jgi:excisionase family DNA binding protein
MRDSRLLLTPERVAERLDVGRTTVYGLLSAGELESVRIGRSRRIPAEAVEGYVARLRAAEPAAAAS